MYYCLMWQVKISGDSVTYSGQSSSMRAKITVWIKLAENPGDAPEHDNNQCVYEDTSSVTDVYAVNNQWNYDM